jgi:hypothetical protein
MMCSSISGLFAGNTAPAQYIITNQSAPPIAARRAEHRELVDPRGPYPHQDTRAPPKTGTWSRLPYVRK